MDVVLTRPTPARQDALFRRRSRRCARRRRSRLKSAHGRETVSAQCLTKLADFFNILSEQMNELSCVEALDRRRSSTVKEALS